MTPRARFITALERRPLTGRVPHFELGVYLTMELFGKVYPNHRSYHQWLQMEEKERQLHRLDIADVFIHSRTLRPQRHSHAAKRTRWTKPCASPTSSGSAAATLLPHAPRRRHLRHSRRRAHGRVLLSHLRRSPVAEGRGAAHGGPGAGGRASWPVTVGWTASRSVDYCFNTGPFISPDHFGEFIAPYLKQLVAGYRELGFYVIKHTDGNITCPSWTTCWTPNPHALHSLDPQAGIDMAEMKRICGDRVCLCGNVNAACWTRAPAAEVIASLRVRLDPRHARLRLHLFHQQPHLHRHAAGPLRTHLDVWRRLGNYD
ncbi:MAG: uroporphyrinogen decarboxylase family protein [Caldilineaceae bacterium]